MRITIWPVLITSILTAVTCVSCVTGEKAMEISGHYQKIDLEIPAIDVQGFTSHEPMNQEHIQEVVKKYSLEGRDAEKVISRKTDELIDESYVMCGGVYWESDRLYEKGLKFRVVGVTEKWIPIEGKVTKVLQIKLAE